MVNKMDKPIDVERAWKDEEYRNSLTPEQLAQLPPNPAGDVEISEDDLDNVSGGNMTCPLSRTGVTRVAVNSGSVCNPI